MRDFITKRYASDNHPWEGIVEEYVEVLLRATTLDATMLLDLLSQGLQSYTWKAFGDYPSQFANILEISLGEDVMKDFVTSIKDKLSVLKDVTVRVKWLSGDRIKLIVVRDLFWLQDREPSKAGDYMKAMRYGLVGPINKGIL